MKILYIGNSEFGTTSLHRAIALERLSHSVVLLDPYKAMGSRLKGFTGKINYHSGYRFLQKIVLKWLRSSIKHLEDIQLIWINSGELLGSRSLKFLKELGIPIVLYNNDDPTGTRDKRRFDMLLSAIPYYDLCVVRREPNIEEYKAKGAQKVLHVYMSYDEIAHSPLEVIPIKFHSEVAFIGTWMRNEKRDVFLLKLINAGISVSIWGGRWQKSPYFELLKPYYKGPFLKGKDYVAAMQGAKICLGFLSKGNRDLHTRRSVEIPYAGGLLCAERTSEHQKMFEEGKEAIFWYDADECIELCKKFLKDDEKREAIRLAGMKKVRNLKVGNEDTCQSILRSLEDLVMKNELLIRR